MTKSRFKQIYVDLDDGRWYVPDADTDSRLRTLRYTSNIPRNKWTLVHNRNTSKIIVQFLDNYTTERKPELIRFIDSNSILVEFAEPVVGEINLIFDRNDFFFGANPTPTPPVTPPTATATPTVTPTISVTPSITPTVTPTITPTVTPTISLTPTSTNLFGDIYLAYQFESGLVDVDDVGNYNLSVLNNFNHLASQGPNSSSAGGNDTVSLARCAYASNLPLANMTTSLTHSVSFFFRRDQANIGTAITALTSQPTNNGFMYRIIQAASNHLSLAAGTWNGFDYPVNFVQIGSTTISNGVWMHVGLSFDHTINTYTYCINGSDTGTIVATRPVTISDANLTLNIGSRYQLSEMSNVDFAQYYYFKDRVLSIPEMQSLYNSGNGLPYP